MAPEPLARLRLAAALAAALAGLGLLLARHRRARARRATEWWRLTAVDAVAALRAGLVTPRELVEQALARIESTNGKACSVVTICAERARAQADDLDRLRACGPLHGLPVVIKDNQRLAGVRSTSGTAMGACNIAQTTDPCVAAIEAAGGIVIGTTNMPEYAAVSSTKAFTMCNL